MPAFYAGKRVGKPLLNGHTYNALFNGKLVWPLDKDTVVSIEITDDKGKPLPKSLAVSGTLKLGAKATYADGHVGDLLTTKNVTFTSRDTSTATVSGNTLTWRHGGTILVTATVNGFTSAAVSISAAYAPESHQGHGRFRQTHRQHHPARRREQEPQGDDPARCGIAGVRGQRRQAGYRRGWRRETDRHPGHAESLTLRVGETAGLDVKVLPEGADQTVTATVADKSIASISRKGVNHGADSSGGCNT